MSRPVLALVLGTAGALATAGCYDPVHDQQVAALGGETSGVSPGPLHRPGQPCLTCHGGQGPASLHMSLGGTVFLYPGSTQPAPNATVQLQDSSGSTWHVVTNAAGNFFVLPGEWTPHYPLTVPTLVDSTNKAALGTQMFTLDNRDGSCASCHTTTAGPNSIGGIWLNLSKDGG